MNELMCGTVYTDTDISRFIKEGVILSRQRIRKEQVQPSSVDLRCSYGKRVWHMPYSFLPRENLSKFLNSNATHSFEMDRKRFFHKRTIYVIEQEESLNLPEDVLARSNPKSTTGRLDIHARLMTENGQTFDNVRRGYKGKLYLEMISNSFDLYIPPGFSFAQMRFLKDGVPLEQGVLEYLTRAENLLTTPAGKPISSERFIHDGAVYLTLDLDPKDPGYIARNDAPALDLSSEKNSIPLSKYFQRVNLIEEGLVIAPESFYLLKSGEVVRIPSDHCAEMVDIETSLGEFRAHYAGFFDPKFTSIAIEEVRNTSKSALLFRDKQSITSLKFFKLIGKPFTTYGEKIKSSYFEQTKVTPAKFFYIDK